MKRLPVAFTALLLCIVMTVFSGCNLTSPNDQSSSDESYQLNIKLPADDVEAEWIDTNDSSSSSTTEGYSPIINGIIGNIDLSVNPTVTNNETAFTKTVDTTKKSVVEINTETASYSQWSGQYIIKGAGSGVIIAHNADKSEYYIVTNNHVIDGAESILVRLSDGTEYDKTKTQLIATDLITDIALVAIETDPGTELYCATFANENTVLLDGQDIFVIGNPLGKLGGSVTKGIISKTERDISVSGVDMKLLQIDASVNPGNSGGALFDMNGNLIGIVNAKYTDESVEGIGFAIPISTVKSVVTALAKYGYVSGRAGLGLYTVDRTYTSGAFSSSTVTYPTVDEGAELTVNYVDDDGQTQTFTFTEGDIILSVDGKSVESTAELLSLLNKYEIGESVTVKVYREEKVISGNRVYYTYKQYELSVTLVEYIPASVLK